MNSLRFSGGRVRVRRHVLGGDDGALDDHDVQPGVERQLVVLADLLRRQRRGGDDAGGLDLLDALGDQLRLDRLLVDGLHLARRLVLRQLRDAGEHVLGVLVAGEDALEVEHGEAAEAARCSIAVSGETTPSIADAEQGKLEPVGTQRPRDVHVIGVPRSAGRDDRNVVESVGATRLLASADLYFHGGILGVGADVKTPMYAEVRR